jgi:transketolase
MGATHHTLEDIGVLRALPNMRIYLPFVPTDVAPAVRAMVSDPSPNYLRLNLGHEMTFPVPPFGPWRRLRAGSRGVVIGIGPVLGNMFSPDVPGLADDLEVWNPGILPIHELPPDLVQRIGETRKILTIEEHGGQCGFHEAVARLLVGRVTGPLRFTSLFATGYPSGKYGSQRWHQEENDLAGDGLRSRFHEAFDD